MRDARPVSADCFDVLIVNRYAMGEQRARSHQAVPREVLDRRTARDFPFDVALAQPVRECARAFDHERSFGWRFRGVHHQRKPIFNCKLRY